MKLYWAPGTCAMAVQIVLEWTGADHEAVKVKPGSDEYKAINPLGSVPAMTDGDNGVMNQAEALLKYLAEKYPQANLGPGDSVMARYEMNRWLSYLTGDLHPAFYPFFGTARFTTSTDDAVLNSIREAAFTRIDTVLAVFEQHMTGPHVVENRRTIADPYAFVMLRWVNLLPKQLSSYKNLQRFHDVFIADQAVQKVLKTHGL